MRKRINERLFIMKNFSNKNNQKILPGMKMIKGFEN